MAIKNLACSRQDQRIFVSWAWDMTGGETEVTVLRLLDGTRLSGRKVSRTEFRSRINTTRGFEFPAAREPLRLLVRDHNSELSLDLTDIPYEITWQLKRERTYHRRTLLREDTVLMLECPCEGCPVGLICYALTLPGERVEVDTPMGFLPGLHRGSNRYGVIVPRGREITLCCDPDREEGRLFRFRRLEDIIV